MHFFVHNRLFCYCYCFTERNENRASSQFSSFEVSGSSIRTFPIISGLLDFQGLPEDRIVITIDHERAHAQLRDIGNLFYARIQQITILQTKPVRNNGKW